MSISPLFQASWLEHARQYVEMIAARLGLNNESFVVEIGSNDGYLLQYFKEKNIPCLGIEPAKNTAEVARTKVLKSSPSFLVLSLPRSW